MTETPNAAVLVPRQKSLKDRDSGRSVRRLYPIHGYFGRNGMGKTQCMVHDTLPDLYAGDPVLSTVALLDAESGEPYPNYTRLTEWQQVLDFEFGSILFDEIVGIAGAREGMSLPVQIQNWLVQLRRDDIAMRWTAPAWKRADTIIRETTLGATLCKGFLAKTGFDDSGRARTWKQRRLFRFKTYAAEDFEDWSVAKEGKLKAVGASWFWSPGSRAQSSYDTYDEVSRIVFPNETGRCARCGGTRRAKPCSCDASDANDYLRGRRSVDIPTFGVEA